MTTDIKSAIAGAIEALEFYADGTKYFGIIKEVNGATVMEWPVYQDGGVKAIEALADIRRIEFVETRHMKLNNSENSYADSIRTGWNMFADHLTTTGHAIVKMEE